MITIILKKRKKEREIEKDIYKRGSGGGIHNEEYYSVICSDKGPLLKALTNLE